MKSELILDDAIAALRNKDKPRAREILDAVIRQDTQNDMAWMYMALASENRKQALACLERATQINPQNDKAWELINRLKSQSTSQNQPQVSSSADESSPLPAQTLAMKKCPYCAEEIQSEAIVCRYCGREISPLRDLNRIGKAKSRNPILPKSPLLVIGLILAGVAILISIAFVVNVQHKRQIELNKMRAIELVKKQTRDFMTVFLTEVSTAEQYTGKAPELSETWEVKRLSGNEYLVSMTIELIQKTKDEDSAFVFGYLSDMFYNHCPGGTAEFLVLLNTSSVLPQNDCARNMSR